MEKNENEYQRSEHKKIRRKSQEKEPQEEPKSEGLESAEGALSAAAQAASAAEKVEISNEEIPELRKKASEYDELLDQCKRIKAEYSNYQKRIEKEKKEWSKRAHRDVLLKILPVIDDLQRIRKACAARQDAESIRGGIEILCASAEKILNSLGVNVIKSVGEKFDPNLHEAILSQETDEFADGTVISEIEQGYLVGDDILLRPSRVVVSVKPQKDKPQV
jgi:molecular chaperone GrpE